MITLYPCPHTGDAYEPSQTQPADLEPRLRWARCTCCTAKGETRQQLGVAEIAQGGQWHGVPRVSLLGLQATARAVRALGRAVREDRG